MATTTNALKRQILSDSKTEKVTATLQSNLTNMIDLALQLKQAHWNVLGPNFRSVHLQLDEIIESVRDASDEIAERVSTLGVAPDGRASSVAEDSDLTQYPDGFQAVQDTVSQVADRLETAIKGLREGIENLEEMDHISQDMLIAISATLEKHLWMVQAQEA